MQRLREAKGRAPTMPRPTQTSAAAAVAQSVAASARATD